MDTTDIFEQEQRKKQVENHVNQDSVKEVNKQDVPLNVMQAQQQERQDEKQNVIPAYANVQVNKREQMVMEAVNGRTISEILTKGVEGSDSKEMAAVKEKLTVCNEFLNKEVPVTEETELVNAQLNSLELSYLEAIEACQYYCDHKNPMFQEGKLRKKAVADTLELLKKEVQLLPELKNMVNAENVSVQGGKVKFINLIAEAGIKAQADNEMINDKKQVNDKEQEAEKTPIENLTYEDFAKMLKTDSADGLEFRGDSLRVVKSGIFSTPSNVTSESNKKMVERFVDLAIQQVEKKQELSDEQKANMKMRLQYQLNVKLLDTQAGAISIGKLRETMEMVDHLSSDVDYALQQDKHIASMEHRIAMAVNENLAIPENEEIKTKAVNKKLERIIEDAKKEGIIIPSVSSDELDYIVKNRLYAIRDNVFNDMKLIYQSMCCLNGGKAADFNRLAMDDKAINCITALCIARMTAATSAGAEAADFQMRKYMSNLVFAHCGNDSLKDDFEKLRITDLARGGNSGLRELVLQQMARTKGWKDKTERVQNGMNNLDEVCSLLEKLRNMQNKAFNEGLTDEEASQLLEAGSRLESITAKKENINDMKLVADKLKGTRFADGFNELLERSKRPEIFTESTRRIARAATIKEHRQDVLEESPLVKAQAQAREQLGITDKTQNIKLSDTSEVLAGLEGKSKDVAAVLLQQKKPSEMIKKNGDDIAKSIAALYFALNSMVSGDAWADVSVAGVQIRLTQRDNNDVELKVGNKRIPMPYNAAFLAYRLEEDISQHIDKYSDKVTADVFQSVFDRTKQRILNQNENDEDASRTLFLNVLKQKTGFDAAFFRNTPVETLVQMAEYAVNGMMDKEDVEQVVKSLEDQNQAMLNEKDTLEMIKVMEQQKKEEKNAEPTVIISEKKQEETDKNQWTPEEAQLIELISDMIFSKDTWKDDLEQREPADRMRMLMYENSDLLVKIVKNPGLIEQTFSRLQLPGADGMVQGIKEQFDQLIQSDAMSKLKVLDEKNMALIFRAVFGDETDMENAKPAINIIIKFGRMSTRAAKSVGKAANMVFSFFGMAKEQEEEEKEEEKDVGIEGMILEQKADMMKKFKDLDDSLNKETQEQVNEIQKQINKSVNGLFNADDGEDEQLFDMSLEKILERNAKGQEGQGKFFKLVLTNYFTNANIMDKRAMLASALRDIKPGNGEALTEDEEKKQMGTFLGGFLKGAGPLLHKILQGLPTEGMDESLKSAIGDMKSKLSPIAPEIVKARMNKMVMNSKGMITKIEVQRSLGAASVGQAFLCKIYGPNLDDGGKDVVIKLLRPDVQNHLEREKKFMIECAEQTSPGMLKTFMGQLGAIEQELDLRIEAKNVELGKVYDKGAKTVQAMKTVDLVSPDTNALMLEKAPGTTVDKYLEEVKAKFEEIKEEYMQNRNVDGGYNAMRKLHKLKEELLKRQGYVADLAYKWVTAGMYEEGFYHGDLHAGNIMVDDKCATVIDFGNAMQITKEQQNSILHMVCAAEAKNVDGFRHHFHLLLSPESEETYQQNKEKFNRMLNILLFKGKDAGMRIAAILSEAQKMGLELPAAINNFSQCQIRLRNTLDDMAKQVDSMNTELGLMSKYDVNNIENADHFALMKKDIRDNIDEHKKFNNKESRKRPEPLEALVKNKLHAGSTFDENVYRLKLTVTPNDMGCLTKLHNCMGLLKKIEMATRTMEIKGREDRIKTVEQCKKHLNEFYDTMVKDFKADTPEFLDMKDKIMNLLDNFDHNGHQMLNDYFDNILKMKKNDMIDTYLIHLDEVRKMRKAENKDEAVLAEKENRLVAEAKELYDRENATPYQKIQNYLLDNTSTSSRETEAILKSMFADKTNHGEELREAYDKIQELKRNNEPLDDKSESVLNFMNLYETAIIQCAHQFEEMEKRITQAKPRNFFDVMGDIVTQRFKGTIWSLGPVGVYRYMLKKNKMDEKYIIEKQRMEDIKNGVNRLVGQICEVSDDYAAMLLDLHMSNEKALDEASRNEKRENAYSKFDEISEKIYKLKGLKAEDREYIKSSVEQYKSLRDMKYIYYIAKRLSDMVADIYEKNGKYVSSQYNRNMWNVVLENITVTLDHKEESNGNNSAE